MATEADAKSLSELERETEHTRADLVDTVDKLHSRVSPQAIKEEVKASVLAFIDDEALSRGAAIAFYAVTSIAPVLLIVIAIAGLAFGQDAAENAIKGQLSALMGEQTADVVQTAVANRPASRREFSRL
jgi:uncharacterized BrkB/YihY/UPF0761 family membrane protein